MDESRFEVDAALYSSAETLSVAVQQMVKAVRFELSDDLKGFRVRGGDTRYHQLDSELGHITSSHFGVVDPQSIKDFRQSFEYYDLCFEDCWSGAFISRQIEDGEPLVLVHLDDHTDMMPTLLEKRHNRLIDPVSGSVFNLGCENAWHQAIDHGVVSIGNFITPFFYHDAPIHVRHLSNQLQTDVQGVLTKAVHYDVVPNRQFAGIEFEEQASGHSSVVSAFDPESLLTDLPAGLLIVHIDLDYFINDFDGDEGHQALTLDHSLMLRVQLKMDRFFDALLRSGRSVQRWIIATSPGFCAARHWVWLLSELQRRIESTAHQIDRGKSINVQPLQRHAVLPATPAAAALNDVITLAAAATPETVADFVLQRYSESYGSDQSVGRRIAMYMEWKARGGFLVEEVARSEPHYIEVVARHCHSDDWWRLAVEMEADRISGVLLGRYPLPQMRIARDDQQVADQYVDYINSLSEVDLFSGAVLVARRGQILVQRAFGLANRDFDIPNTLETRFNVASLTKSWTATAICKLIEQGELSFDTTLDTFLPYPTSDAAATIQIRHLLSHTSGLDGYFTEEFDKTARKNMRSVDDYLALTRDQLPKFPPGTQWSYSNTGMVLLGKILEQICGSTYFDVMQELVLKPAGMNDSGFPELDFVNKNTAVGYGKAWSKDGLRWKNSLYEGVIKGGPAGCAYATVGDVFRFAEAFRGGRLVSGDMMKMMTTAREELSSPDYGYGFAIHPERALYGHSGGLIGASANLDIFEDPEGWVVVVLANDLTMRTPVLKARQFIGLTVPENEEARAYLPHAGLVPR